MTTDYASLLHKPVDQVSEADIQALVDNQVVEGKVIEYKRTLPGYKEDDKREFLADVSSFANASGGVLLYGVPESKGIPLLPVGLQIPDPDALVLQLESMILTGISPRIPNFSARAVPLQAGGFVVIVRIPRSWALPHRVTYRGHDKFYSRNSAGKYALDVQELRAAFLLGPSIADRVRSFRQDRLARIVSGETPIELEEGAKLVLHAVPIRSVEPGVRFDVSTLRPHHMGLLHAPTIGYTGERFNLDGLLTYDKPRGQSEAQSYFQVFWNGIIETVDMYHFPSIPGSTVMSGYHLEKAIIESLPRYFQIQRLLGLEPPVFLMLTFLGVANLTVVAKEGISRGRPIDRDTLIIPEMLVEDFNTPAASIAKVLLESLWNASGWPKSPHYDDSGNWGGLR